MRRGSFSIFAVFLLGLREQSQRRLVRARSLPDRIQARHQRPGYIFEGRSRITVSDQYTKHWPASILPRALIGR
jgi:hypothetical protein